MPVPRLYVPHPLAEGQPLDLPAGAARHVQVLRLQPGAPLRLFNGEGIEFDATVVRMGRSDVAVLVGAGEAVERELPLAVTLALGMPANDRMDALVEKATELGVAAIQPLLCERSVLRLAGERADKRREHWQGIAVAAAEQCGRTRVPVIEPVQDIARWLAGGPAAGGMRWLLSLGEPLPALATMAVAPAAVCVLSGPEGGLTPREEALAHTAGFQPVSLGPRVLRADTAPLAVLAWLGVGCGR
ncbi:16S rRNA (uracil(1498)-N(3))-methyltransferase [Ideonella sp. BN130291]|uniref:16S rRNA (uracil(1498)-N(3))-methyltransferase n=1 Tax=Ideonella sp. BN130291 TaxID=3112940 RepID=UPI002E272D84|nr:16S rRNA (uracil(1498)-N(3))-methyltransferase [Ideonella sp. BN130291]